MSPSPPPRPEPPSWGRARTAAPPARWPRSPPTTRTPGPGSGRPSAPATGASPSWSQNGPRRSTCTCSASSTITPAPKPRSPPILPRRTSRPGPRVDWPSVDAEEVRLAGRRLAGRYELEAEVASGGMGTVWRARDEVLGRPVAVKVLHEHLARDPDLLDRFRLEAVAAARLNHPAIVRVFDTGIDDGVCYIVMELFEGTTLQAVLAERGTLQPEEAARIVGSALHGLGHAHRQGVIHRDVKPGNILLDRDGWVKVTDFGIAKAAFAGDDLTTTGNLLGTSRYLAPEQVTGGPTDARTDLYSTGIVLSEALEQAVPTGAPPAPPLPTEPIESRGTSSVRSWFAVPLLVLLVAGLAVGGFWVLGQVLDDGLGAGNGGGPNPASSALPAQAIGTYDPAELGGDESEHDEEVGLATDGRPGTFWQTSSYSRPDLGGLKPGVGIVLALEQPSEVAGLRVVSDSPGFDFGVYASDTPDAFDVASRPLASVTAEEVTELEVGPVETTYLLIWITELAEVGEYRAYINEVEVFAP